MDEQSRHLAEEWTKALNAALNGRGGGKPGICQGSCTATPEQVEEFLRKAL